MKPIIKCSKIKETASHLLKKHRVPFIAKGGCGDCGRTGQESSLLDTFVRPLVSIQGALDHSCSSTKNLRVVAAQEQKLNSVDEVRLVLGAPHSGTQSASTFDASAHQLPSPVRAVVDQPSLASVD